MELEILKKLLESDLLNEETKAELTTQWKTAVDAYLAEERSKLEVEVHTTLTEEFVKAKEELAEKLDKTLNEVVEREFTELRDEIENFRDLEVETAEKIAEEKERLAERFGDELNALVEKLDVFLDQRIEEEFKEFSADLAAVKKLEFGRSIFEAFEAEFKKHRKSDMLDVEQELAETIDKLADAEKRLEEIESSRLAEARNAKMDELLTNLGGTAREQMKIILSNVATEKLDEAYKIYIGRIIKEAVVEKKEEPKEQKELKESKTVEKMVTGNDEPTELTETAKPSEQLSRMRRLAGLNK